MQTTLEDATADEQLFVMKKVLAVAINKAAIQLDVAQTSEIESAIKKTSDAIFKVVSESGIYLDWPLDDIILFKTAVLQGVKVAIHGRWRANYCK